MSDELLIKSEIEELLYNWLYWLGTRRFYAPPLPPNILAMLQQEHGRNKEPPDARNDALAAAFNLVISEAPDDYRLPFLYVYLRQLRPKPIKALAYDLNINQDTVYWRAHHVAPKYLSQTKSLAILNSQIQKEVEGYVD
jgi:DNA-directed RNA polymerase specialized sigma24 family protein